MRTASAVLGVLALLVGGLVIAQLLVRAQTGPLPLVSALETPLLVLVGVMAVAGLLGTLPWRRGRTPDRGGRGRALFRLGLLGVVVLAVVRAGGELWSPDGAVDSQEREVVVLSWNLDPGARSVDASIEGIAAIEADLVALQELTPDVAAAIEADERLARRYPYRILEPRAGSDGLGLLARQPLLVRGRESAPPVLRAGWLLDNGTIVDVLDVHPRPPDVDWLGPFPVGLDTRARDTALGAIADRVAAVQDPGLALVVGDLNATQGEPGLAPLVSMLRDAHAAAGTGPGFTWRPRLLEGLGIGVIRIDHVLAGSRLQPAATAVDCSLPGDHCRLVVTARVKVVEPQPAGS